MGLHLSSNGDGGFVVSQFGFLVYGFILEGDGGR